MGSASTELSLVEEYQRILSHAGSSQIIERVQVEELPMKGEHLGSDCACVSLWIKYSSSNRPRELFVKRVSSNPPDFFKDVGLFNKEASFFNVLLQDLRDVHGRSSALSSSQPLDFFPNCLYADEQLIVMDNLIVKGEQSYFLCSKMEKHDLAFARYVMEKLALFHSLSYVEANPDFQAYLRRYPFLEERMYVPGKEEFNISYDNLIRVRMAIMKASSVPQASSVIKFLENGLGTVYAHVIRAISGEGNKSRRHRHLFHVVNHGDCWITNMLFKLDPTTRQIAHHVFLDFQLMRLGSPNLDLCYYLFTSVKPSVLKEHWKSLLEYYYECLKSNVNELYKSGCGSGSGGENREFQHTFQEFLADFKEKFSFGFWLNMTFFTGFDILPHLDMAKVERDRDEESGLGEQAQAWINENRERAAELAEEVATLVEIHGAIMTD